MTMRALFLLLTLVFGVVALDPAAAADNGQRRARDAVTRGDIMPLDQVLAIVRGAVPGRVLDVDLDQRGDRWTYRVKVLSDDGSVARVMIDAHSGQIRGVRGGRRRR